MVSEISSKASDSMRTASLDEASDLLRKLAGNRLAGESMKAVFRRVSRKLSNWSDSRIRDVWHRDRRVRIRAEEVEQLRALVDRQGNTKDELEELRSTVARLAKYEAMLERIDAEFFGPQISAARDQTGEARGLLGAIGLRLRSGSGG
jgi:hypothetical protein